MSNLPPATAPTAPVAPSNLVSRAVSDGLLTMAPGQLVERMRLLDEVRRIAMQEGTDYYSLQTRKVTGTDGVEREVPQFSLSKAGAEKLVVMFGLTPDIESVVIVDDPSAPRTISVGVWQEDPTTHRKRKVFEEQNVVGFYEVKSTCSVWASNGRLLARASGTCNSTEAAFRGTPYSDAKNPILKRSEKRALVAAVLMATASSGMFTQDLEDLVDHDAPGASQGSQGSQAQAGGHQGGGAAGASPAASGAQGGAKVGWLSEGQKRLIHAKGGARNEPEPVREAMIAQIDGKGWKDGKPILEEIAKDTDKGAEFWAKVHSVVMAKMAPATPAQGEGSTPPPPPADGDGF